MMRSHLGAVSVVPSGGSFIDADRSSTSRTSAGLRSRLNIWTPHSLPAVPPVPDVGIVPAVPPVPPGMVPALVPPAPLEELPPLLVPPLSPTASPAGPDDAEHAPSAPVNAKKSDIEENVFMGTSLPSKLRKRTSLLDVE